MHDLQRREWAASAGHQPDPARPGSGIAGSAGCVAAGAAGVAAAGLYDAFVIAGWAGSRLNPADAFVSELEVPGQPASGGFRAVDLASGVLIVILAVVVNRHLRHGPAATVGSMWLAVLGGASVADAWYPMPCAPSVDPTCRRRLDEVGLLAQLHQRHTLSSTLGVLAGVVAMWLLTPSSGGRPVSWLSQPWRLGAVVLAVVATLEVPLIYAGHGAGALERVHVLLISAWLAALSIRLIRHGLRLAGMAKPTTSPSPTGPRSGRWPARQGPPPAGTRAG